MSRTLSSIAMAFVFGIGGAALAHRHEDGEKVRVISAQDIKEKLDGKEARVTVVEVTIGPGQSGLAHRHPGPGFGYSSFRVRELIKQCQIEWWSYNKASWVTGQVLAVDGGLSIA